MGLGDGASGKVTSPPPAVGATLIAASVVVLIIGMGWLSRGSGDPEDRLAMPVVDGVTQATDEDGRAIEVPPSQPATAVSFGSNGAILRPDPVRARVVTDDGREVLVPLPPNTTVDTTTGEIIPARPGTTTRPGGTTTPTDGTGTTPTTRRPSTSSPTNPPTTTAPPTTPPTTEPPPTTTEPPPPTTEAPTTTEPPPPTTEATVPDLGDILDDILP